MPKIVKIEPDVRAVLERATVEGPPERPVVKLNAPDLERGLYLKVDKALRAGGGKWNRSAGGHVFDQAVGVDLAGWLETGVVVDRKRTAEQFFTPAHIAASVVKIAEIKSTDHVLEPSAGDGRLVEAAWGKAGFFTLVEKDDALAQGLLERYGKAHGIGIWLGDFMTWVPRAAAPIDKVLMNPPFSRGQDMAHVLRAFEFLTPGGILVAVMSPHWTFAENRAANDFRVFLSRLGDEAYDWFPLPDDTFKSEGTAVNTGILVIYKGA